MGIIVDGGGERETFAGGKLRLDLVSPQFVAEVAKVLGFGAKKYAPNNWMRGMDWGHNIGSVERHIAAFKSGEAVDPESGLPHLSHAACGIMFLLWWAHGPNAALYADKDDRPFKPLASSP